MADDRKPKRMPVKINDEVLKGVYSNSLMVLHTRNEFVIDFATMFPPQGSVNARIIVRPESIKRMAQALVENIDKYEARYGEIKLPPPAEDFPEFS